ncbi:MAG: hypothetical protein KUG79_15155 [Pseudomonadales bacterium]|nr:hypothetical protein [Pseudomonadales bacterium]
MKDLTPKRAANNSLIDALFGLKVKLDKIDQCLEMTAVEGAELQQNDEIVWVVLGVLSLQKKTSRWLAGIGAELPSNHPSKSFSNDDKTPLKMPANLFR